MKIEHVKGHQDDKTRYQDLDIKEKLNIDADTIVTTTVSIPIKTHTIYLPFALYIDNRYTHHRSDYTIGAVSHKHEAQAFLRNKYKRLSKIFRSIN